MVFTHDTEVALLAAAALVNSAVDPDTLTDVDGLDDLLRRFPMSGRIEHSEAEVAHMQRLRGELRQLWCGEEAQVAQLCNTLLRRHQALPQVVRHDEWDWHLHAVGAEAPLAERYAVEAAMAMVDVLRAGELDRLRHCAAEDCHGVVVDLSRNRSRRFCDSGCGNRANVAAYRARRRDRADAS